MKIKDWYTTKEFSKIAGVSVKTLQRKKELLLKKYNRSIKKTKNGNKYKFELLKQFLSKDIYDILKENKSLKNNIDKLRSSDLLGTTLSQMKWSNFITISHKKNLSIDECYDSMSILYNSIIEAYPKSEVRMFFTTEPYKDRQGHHNHIILFVENKNYIVIEKLIKHKYSDSIIDIQEFDPYQPAIFYSAKKGLPGLGWDFFSTKQSEKNNVDRLIL